jgi:rare lipoprotein A
MQTSLSLIVLAGCLSSSANLLPVVAQDLEATSSPRRLDVALSKSISAYKEKRASREAGQNLVNEKVIETSLESRPLSEVAPADNLSPVAKDSSGSLEVVHVSTGEASWYGPGFFGNRTANGETFRPGTMTAAHPTLPFGTKVRVTNLWNGQSTVVRINDRGPFVGNRVIDIAHGAANHLGLISSGIAQVRLEVLR